MIALANVGSLDWWSSLMGLIVTGISVVVGIAGLVSSIKALVSRMKTNTARQNIALLQSAAEASMKSAEASGASGADKKTAVLEAVEKAALSAGIDWTDELNGTISDFIDQSIEFANSIHKASGK